MSRKKFRKKPPHKLTKAGTFSCYSMDGIVTIEGVSTSFSMEELEFLSYARDLQSPESPESPNWNFDLLIQRDLNETRARKIGTYLLPEVTDTVEDKIVFLPPLIAAIVITNENGDLEVFYPPREDSIKEDADGKVYLRKWGDALEVRNYSPNEGADAVKIEHCSDALPVDIDIDISLADIEMICPKKDSAGIKLVVIDGQHRLYALRDQYQKDPERMRNWLIPVMLVYPPNATEKSQNSSRQTIKIPQIFRQLFVDVNKNSVNVSGHFIILLSDTTLGCTICRSFCQKIINTSNNDLAMIEWNTESDKESKTITKEYSITSIGVLYDALDSIFKKKDKINLLRHIMGINDNLFRDEDEDEDEKLPTLFPWQEFKLKHKQKLKELVYETFIPCLFEIFFHSKCYGKIKNSFDHALEEISANYEKNPAINSLRESLKYGESLPLKTNTDKIQLGKIKDEFIKEFDGEFNAEKSSINIIRKKIFQKGMISAWIEMLNIAKDHQLDALATTKEFVKLLDHAIEIDLFFIDRNHSYLQESVFRNHRIIVTNYGATQISRLILACLKNINHNNKSLDLKFNRAQKERLAELGNNSERNFLNDLEIEQEKVFKKIYQADEDIDRETRKRLEDLEHEDKPEFNKQVKEQIQPKYKKACKQLEEILG